MSQFPLLAIAVLSLFTSCAVPNPRVASKVNREAALRGIPMDPLQWKLITAGANRQEVTMFTLFGNDTAVLYARKPLSEQYPAGSQLFLVTWRSQEDTRWFGGRIPAAPKLVEVLDIRDSGGGQIERVYSRYEGAALKKVTLEDRLAASRINYFRSLRAAVMP